jgi:hypothetical protein
MNFLIVNNIYILHVYKMGMDGTLHFPLPSINRLNQTQLATFSSLSFWAFFRGSYLLYFNVYLPTTTLLYFPVDAEPPMLVKLPRPTSVLALTLIVPPLPPPPL